MSFEETQKEMRKSQRGKTETERLLGDLKWIYDPLSLPVTLPRSRQAVTSGSLGGEWNRNRQRDAFGPEIRLNETFFKSLTNVWRVIAGFAIGSPEWIMNLPWLTEIFSELNEAHRNSETSDLCGDFEQLLFSLFINKRKKVGKNVPETKEFCLSWVSWTDFELFSFIVSLMSQNYSSLGVSSGPGTSRKIL